MTIKSRTLPERKRAAFLRYTAGILLVKVKGTDGTGGVRQIIDGNGSDLAKNMTLEGMSYSLKVAASGKNRLANGELVEITGKYIKVLAERMTAVELVLLGVPLDTSLMSAADWDSLPGIGPALAEEIVRYSQKNGGIASIEMLAELPGFGEGTIKKLRPFFRSR